MSEPDFEGLYHLSVDDYRYRASVLTTVVKACKDATNELMNETPPEDWETLARLLDLQIEAAETFILEVDMESLIDIVESAQTAFEVQEAEAAEEAARRDKVKW